MRKWNRDEIILTDPFFSKGGVNNMLPDDAVLACVYDLNLGIDTEGEAAFFRRTGTGDELWTVFPGNLRFIRRLIIRPAGGTKPGRGAMRSIEPLSAGCAFAVPARGDETRSCCDLLGMLFFSRVGHYWPEKFRAAGIIDEATYYGVKGEVEREIDENMRRDRERETEIVALARDLGLSPGPTGTDPGYWNARCPGKRHPLLMKADVNEFFCGYCGRKGGMEELEAFVKERKGR